MKKIKKLISSIKKDGLLLTIKKIINKFKLIIARNRVKKNEINLAKELNIDNFKRVIIFENQFGWAKIMKQRPQQIASAIDDKTLFIYGTTHMEIGNINGIKKIKDNLILMDLVIYKQKIIELLKNVKNKYLMIYSTDYIPIEVLKPYLDAGFKLIYEFVDNIDEKLCGKETAKLLKERQEKIINKYNPYIVTTATKLYNIIKELKEDANIALITNGVDYEHFSTAQAPTKEIEKIRKPGDIIIGYYGALASWFDYELIKKLAKSNSKFKIVLIGLDYDKTLDKSGILNLKNVYYLGKKNYDELPNYLHDFDICTIPFVINEITLSTSPVKVFEYMAAKKPIVTTDLPECRKYKSILIGKDSEEFIKKIELAISNMNNEKYLNLLEKEAKENDWNNKFKNLLELITKGENDEG